jgi:hypothetical protein
MIQKMSDVQDVDTKLESILMSPKEVGYKVKRWKTQEVNTKAILVRIVDTQEDFRRFVHGVTPS